VLDTETTTDPTQALLVGSYRYYRWRGRHLVCVEEGLIHADELPVERPAEFRVLERYVATHRAEVARGQKAQLKLLSRRQFVSDRLWKAHQAGALLVGFNLLFDLTRLGIECGEARVQRFRGQQYYGGFSLVLWDYHSQSGPREHAFRPRLCFKVIDSKRALMGWVPPRKPPA
jgi:hypothetical protein